MKVLYVPVFRAPVSYVVTLGRRWSLLEHMLLVSLADGRKSVAELAKSANAPSRVVVEALTNLLRAGWIEVRSGPEGALFVATAVGKQRALEQELQPELRREIKWTSLCMERLTGSWMRTDDIELVYKHDLPEDAAAITPVLSSINYDDPSVRGLINLRSDEGFEGFQPTGWLPSRPFMRVIIDVGEVQSGLPIYTPPKLDHALLAASEAFPDLPTNLEIGAAPANSVSFDMRDTIQPDDLVVGGRQHLEILKVSLASARSLVFIHSCFLDPAVVESLLPDLERAGRRGVRVDLLWGLFTDPESSDKPRPITQTEQVLDKLPPTVRRKVQLSPISSGSHCKVIVFDSGPGIWTSIVGSCNFLSSWFEAIEISVRSRSTRLAAQLLGYLIHGQLPASGTWPPVVRRLNTAWNVARVGAASAPEAGAHRLSLLADEDHYACVTSARDLAKRDIILGCDLYGLAAETSVLVPLQRAAEMGARATIFFRRPSKRLKEDDRSPEAATLAARGIKLINVDDLHGKFLVWDDSSVVVTSFNWTAAVVDGTRSRGAELGLLVEGAGLRELLADKLEQASKGTLRLRDATG
ncbi:MAG: Rrf2 family transcriptional regulator [Alphaproteobacteria bacterium]|nr:Rrf2 family transcriptional regulator [Alphaproteobacteria bacterium]MCW5739413.1 Rrf2 family transcriptional regulator [Alphaproteobacteria bacterium]